MTPQSPAPARLVALIGALAQERQAVHTTGFPLDPEKMLPVADVILVIGDASGAMTHRYTVYGESGGDSWHASLGEAQEQAAEEYGIALGEWLEVPDDVGDAHQFAVRYAADRLDSRGGW